MRRRDVIISPEAQDDLIHLYDWIAETATRYVAIGYIDRLERYCLGLDMASERGHRRDDIRIGLRIVGFERKVTIAFTVDESAVTVLRFFYGGQNWEADLL